MRLILWTALAVSLSPPVFAKDIVRLDPGEENYSWHIATLCSLAFTTEKKEEKVNTAYNEGFCEGIALGALQVVLTDVLAYEKASGASNPKHVECLHSKLQLSFRDHRKTLQDAFKAYPEVSFGLPTINAYRAINMQIKQSCRELF